jgi:hypothetical protein
LNAAAVDEVVLRYAHGPTVSLHPSIERAREGLNAILAGLRPITDSEMEFAWEWNGEQADVRYGFYRLYELLEGEAAEAARFVGDAGRSEARGPIAAATAARWEWHGVLAALGDDDLDADPGGNEWTVRQTLGHTLNSQRAYTWFTAWWLSLRDAPRDEYLKGFPPEDMARFEAHEATEGSGSLAEIRARMDEIMDGGAARMALLTPEEFGARARWSGIDVTVGFRLWRWSSHIREHTVQLDKTTAMLDRRPTEAERLLRVIAAAYGRLEAQVIGLRPEAVEHAAPGGRSAADVLDETAAVLSQYAASIPAAARAAVPVTAE